MVFRGRPDSAKLRELGDQAMKVLEDDGQALCIRSDWRERVKAIRPEVLDFQARRNGITRVELPPGYALQWGGEYEDSGRARAALAEPLPYVLALMVFIVVCLFNSFRTTLLIWLIIPMVIMFGLSFAAVLSLIVTPVLYAIFYRIKETANAPSGAQ
jgi:multidrug efflux pump subunit AcrB